MSSDAALLSKAKESVLVASANVPENTQRVAGVRLGSSSDAVSDCYAAQLCTGFQATQLGRACDIVSEMLRNRDADDEERCIVYMGVAGNLFSTGVRDALRFAAINRQLDRIVVSAGGVEHDLRRLFRHHDYNASPLGVAIAAGRQRISNISYIARECTARGTSCCFPHVLEDAVTWIKASRRHCRVIETDMVPRGGEPKFRKPVFDAEFSRVCVTPSGFYAAVAEYFDSVLPAEVADDSFAIRCARNQIPIYCPSFVDGDAAELLVDDETVAVDLTEDLNALNRSALKAKRTGMIIIGGGVIKHHVCNANLMRNGADYAVYLSTAQEFDGSDGGARPDEAVSWGKLKADAQSAKVCAEATVAVPVIVGRAFVPAAIAVAAATRVAP